MDRGRFQKFNTLIIKDPNGKSSLSPAYYSRITVGLLQRVTINFRMASANGWKAKRQDEIVWSPDSQLPKNHYRCFAQTYKALLAGIRMPMAILYRPDLEIKVWARVYMCWTKTFLFRSSFRKTVSKKSAAHSLLELKPLWSLRADSLLPLQPTLIRRSTGKKRLFCRWSTSLRVHRCIKQAFFSTVVSESFNYGSRVFTEIRKRWSRNSLRIRLSCDRGLMRSDGEEVLLHYNKITFPGL